MDLDNLDNVLVRGNEGIVIESQILPPNCGDNIHTDKSFGTSVFAFKE